MYFQYIEPSLRILHKHVTSFGHLFEDCQTKSLNLVSIWIS